MRRLPVVAIAALGTLVAAGMASAHVIATPAFLPSGSADSITLSGPNERADPMTAFSVTAPAGLEIEHAHPTDGWTEEFDDTTATWTGGSLAANEEASFSITLKAERGPGAIALDAKQLYDDGAVVSWPVAITIIPATESPSQNLALAGVVGLLGLLTLVAIATIAWRRRS